MGTFKILLTCGLTMSLAFACVTKVIQQPAPSPIVKILKDKTLWGKDYPAALAYLSSWNKIGERTVTIFSVQAVGYTRYETHEKAQRTASELARAMKEPQPQPNDEFDDLIGEVIKRPPPFQAREVTLLEDGATRVGWRDSLLQFLGQGLTLEMVQEHLGPPEKVTREIVPSEEERRSAILTLYRYAGGAIVFAETDWAPRPGFVDRVLFDVPTLTAVVFK